MLDLLSLYNALLATAWMKSDGEGFVTVTNKTDPVQVGGKVLVLPTATQLKRPDVVNRIMFHPLLESALKGESPVTTQLRYSMSVRLNYTIGTVLRELVQLAASPAEHAKLTPTQSEILSPLKDADEKMLNNFSKMLVNATQAKGVDSTFVTIYLKRGGEVDGRNYSRAAIITFPFYEELLKTPDDKVYFGVQLRVKDIETLRSLFRHVFPGIDKHFYNKGSDSDIAPYLEALMKGVAGIIGVTNDLVAMYGKFIEDHETLVIEDEWADAFENLGAYQGPIRMIPGQFTSDGSGRVADEVERGATVASGAGATQEHAGQHQTGYQGNGEQRPTRMADLMAQRQQNLQNQQPIFGQPQHQPSQPSNRPMSFKELMRERQRNEQNAGTGLFNNQPSNNGGWPSPQQNQPAPRSTYGGSRFNNSF